MSGDAARLQMTWGTTTVPLQVVVQPSRPVELAANVRATYVGEYDMGMVEGIGWPSTGRLERRRADCVQGCPSRSIRATSSSSTSSLRDHRFNPVLYRADKLFNVEMGAILEFAVTDDRAGAVTLRTIEGTALGEGRRGGKQ